jgi:hypothetical protein
MLAANNLMDEETKRICAKEETRRSQIKEKEETIRAQEETRRSQFKEKEETRRAQIVAAGNVSCAMATLIPSLEGDDKRCQQTAVHVCCRRLPQIADGATVRTPGVDGDRVDR